MPVTVPSKADNAFCQSWVSTKLTLKKKINQPINQICLSIDFISDSR